MPLNFCRSLEVKATYLIPLIGQCEDTSCRLYLPHRGFTLCMSVKSNTPMALNSQFQIPFPCISTLCIHYLQLSSKHVFSFLFSVGEQPACGLEICWLLSRVYQKRRKMKGKLLRGFLSEVSIRTVLLFIFL